MHEGVGARIDSERNRGLRRDIAMRFLSQLLTDDERTRFYGLPATCRLRNNTKILNPEKLVGGEQIWIGKNSCIDASGGLTIGDHTFIRGSPAKPVTQATGAFVQRLREELLDQRGGQA